MGATLNAVEKSKAQLLPGDEHRFCGRLALIKLLMLKKLPHVSKDTYFECTEVQVRRLNLSSRFYVVASTSSRNSPV